jgi:hypothetical protein
MRNFQLLNEIDGEEALSDSAFAVDDERRWVYNESQDNCTESFACFPQLASQKPNIRSFRGESGVFVRCVCAAFGMSHDGKSVGVHEFVQE